MMLLATHVPVLAATLYCAVNVVVPSFSVVTNEKLLLSLTLAESALIRTARVSSAANVVAPLSVTLMWQPLLLLLLLHTALSVTIALCEPVTATLVEAAVPVAGAA